MNAPILLNERRYTLPIQAVPILGVLGLSSGWRQLGGVWGHQISLWGWAGCWARCWVLRGAFDLGGSSLHQRVWGVLQIEVGQGVAIEGWFWQGQSGQRGWGQDCSGCGASFVVSEFVDVAQRVVCTGGVDLGHSRGGC